jgi:positive phototaxis protein PixI
MSDLPAVFESQSFSQGMQDVTPIAPEDTPEVISEQFLRLYLVPDTTVLLPVEQLTEVLNMAIAQITPIAHMPAWVMGIYNWRGEILWVADLGHLCGLTPWYQQPGSTSVYPAVVLQIKQVEAVFGSTQTHTLALVVNRVEDIEWCDPNQIKALASSNIASKIARFLQGYWWKPDDSTLAVLDGKLIIAAMPKS